MNTKKIGLVFDIAIIPMLIFLLSFNVFFAHGPIVSIDEGSHLSWVNSLFHGQVPYRDSYLIYGLIYELIPALIMCVVGKSIVVLRACYEFGMIFWLLIAYFFGRLMLKRRFFAYIFAWLLIATRVVPFWSSRWGGMRNAIPFLALICLYMFNKKKSNLWLYAAGCINGIALFYTQESGIALLAASGIFLLTLRLTNPVCKKMSPVSLGIRYGIGMGIVLLPAYVYLLAHKALMAYLVTCFVDMPFKFPKYLVDVYPYMSVLLKTNIVSAISDPQLARAFLFCTAFILYGVSFIYIIFSFIPHPVPLCGTGGIPPHGPVPYGTRLEKKGTAGVLRQAQDGSKDGERSRTINPWGSIRKHKPDTHTGLERGNIILVSVFGFFVLIFAIRQIHGMQFNIAAPCVVLIGCALWEKLFFYLFNIIKKRNVLPLLRIAVFFINGAIALLALFLIYYFSHPLASLRGAYDTMFRYEERLSVLAQESSVLSIERARGVLVPKKQAEELEFVVAFIKNNTSKDDTIFVFPHNGEYYFLTERACASRFTLATFAMISPEYEDEVIRDLMRKKPHYVIYVKDAYVLTHFNPIASEKRIPKVFNYIMEHYLPVENIHNTYILKLK
ncbi:MAG: hypothetical protein V1893_03640 [Candidatus Omnitrophota bacterium]